MCVFKKPIFGGKTFELNNLNFAFESDYLQRIELFREI